MNYKDALTKKALELNEEILWLDTDEFLVEPRSFIERMKARLITWLVLNSK